MKQSKKRARRGDAIRETSSGLEEVSANVLPELLSRISLLEDSYTQTEELKTRVATLEARVTELEGELIRAEDRDFSIGRGVSPTIQAIREGKTSVLAERLLRGADPNHDDGIGGTCLIHSVSGVPRPECARLLIEHGADVSYCFPADNASLLLMLVESFDDAIESSFCSGDYILTADLLVTAGAPIDVVQDGENRTAMSILLEEMDPSQLGTKRYRERLGLVNVLKRARWEKYNAHGHNPFVGASPVESAWLLLTGGADEDTGGDKRIDMTRLRSIKPNLRKDVMTSLNQHNGMRETFVHLLLTMKNANNPSPFCSLRGHESTILPLIATYAGSVGWSLQKLQEAKTVLKDAIERFNVDGASGDSFYGEGDDGDDDSYEIDIDEDDNEEEEEHSEDGVSDSDDGDY